MESGAYRTEGSGLSGLWFTWLAAMATGGFLIGKRLGRDDRRAMLTLLVAFLLMAVWSWLVHHPAVMVQVLPLWMLSHIEGVGAVPIFMVVTGVAWSKATTPNHKRLTILAVFFGCIFFLQGSLWMLQAVTRVLLRASCMRDGLTALRHPDQ